MILPPRSPIRLPDAPAAEDRKGKAGFDALLDESENASRIQLPQVKLEKKEEGPREEEEEDTSDPTSASLILLEISDAEPAGRPRLQKGDNPAPGHRHDQLGNVQSALERMDVRMAVSRMTTAEAAIRMVTPMPADPIRDLGEVVELPRPAAPVAEPAPATTDATATGEVGSSESASASADDDASDRQSGCGAREPTPSQALEAGTTATAFTLLPSVVPSEEATLPAATADERAAAASMLLDAQAGVADGITVHLDDVLGRWEVDVIRKGNELGLVLRGDATLHDAVRQASGELRDRLAKDGVTLTQLHFQSLDRTESSRSAVTATAEASSASTSTGGEPQERGARREEAPPWPPPRARRIVSAAADAGHRRNGLDLSA